MYKGMQIYVEKQNDFEVDIYSPVKVAIISETWGRLHYKLGGF